MCQKLIDSSLLTHDEQAWLNDYHEEVREKTWDLIKGDPVVERWLKKETQPM